MLSGGSSNWSEESSWVKMAAAEGPVGDGDLWQTWLPNHVVFLRLREGLKNQSPTDSEKPASSSLPSSPPLPPQLLTRNLIFGLGGELFLWDGEGSSFLVVRLRGLVGGSEEPSLSQYQVRPGRLERDPRAGSELVFLFRSDLGCFSSSGGCAIRGQPTSSRKALPIRHVY